MSPADDVMQHVTFTTPVRVDSPDRLANLLAVVQHLRTAYPSRIIVGVEQTDQFRALLPNSVEVVEVPNPETLPFHHTRATNTMARMVTTPVLVNIETDIMIPPQQMRAAVDAVLRDEADHVLPFDFAVDVRRAERTAFARRSLTGALADGRPRWSWPVIGGCVVWRRTTFQRVGMENEHLIAWGLDDDERMARGANLGARQLRIPGPLFHLEHERGPDSSARPEYATSNYAEFARIRDMSLEGLTDEVDSWPWVHGPPAAQRPVSADDLTIIVPVRIDNDDRLRNLLAVLRAARASTTARVLVGIGDPDSVADWVPAGVELLPVHDPPGAFHRTRVLNQLAAAVHTPYLANLDADVVVPAAQWADSLTRLRTGADMVLPFHGPVTDVPFAHHPWLERGDIESMPRVFHGLLHPAGVGCCVLWRRSAYCVAGMENEHFVSWGAEDDERLARARILGLDVQRSTGPIYHLRHGRGPDSGDDNPHFADNLAERDRISTMTGDELSAEVATWPWVAITRPATQ
jgi:hypothetical protein